jgi:hypothetical protein
MANDESLQLPLHCPLIIEGEEGKATGGRQFARESPADVRQTATLAALGTQEDARVGSSGTTGSTTSSRSSRSSRMAPAWR